MEIFMYIIAIMLYSTFIFVYYRHTQDKKFEFQLKLEAIKNKKNDHVESMSYKDLLSIVNDIIGYYVNDEYLHSALPKSTTDEEITLVFNQVHKSIAAKTEMGLSQDVKNALMGYISKEHMITYIKDTSRLVLVAKIEQNRRK